jgi:phenylacetate-coenzyme A ligase PaaK-like adenylate-forming protein
LPTIQVEGRTDEILSFRGQDGQTVELLPMAVSTVVEETPGVHRCQVIQTTPATLTVRLEETPGAERTQVWEAVVERLQTYLEAQGLPFVSVERAAEAPMPDPRSGKFRHVWADLHTLMSNAQAAPEVSTPG